MAAEVSPPEATHLNADNPAQVDVSTTVLDGYTGAYQLQSNIIMTITRKGGQLSTQMTGQPAIDIYPSSATDFFYKVVKARISFVPDAQGQVTSLVLHQNGRNMTMPRVDVAVAEQVEANLQAKIQSQSATPGSEAALRRLIAGQISGNPDYARMSPELAQAARDQLPRTSIVFKQLGALKSVEFKGVGNQGWDIYDVTFEHGSAQYRLVLSSDGIITGALVTQLP